MSGRRNEDKTCRDSFTQAYRPGQAEIVMSVCEKTDVKAFSQTDLFMPNTAFLSFTVKYSKYTNNTKCMHFFMTDRKL